MLRSQGFKGEQKQVVFDSSVWSPNSCQKLQYVKYTSKRVTDQLNVDNLGAAGI